MHTRSFHTFSDARFIARVNNFSKAIKGSAQINFCFFLRVITWKVSDSGEINCSDIPILGARSFSSQIKVLLHSYYTIKYSIIDLIELFFPNRSRSEKRNKSHGEEYSTHQSGGQQVSGTSSSTLPSLVVS